jgi:hypothetical protein
MVGVFNWGPIEELVTITTNEAELVKRFGKPDNATSVFFHSAQNYLLYSAPLVISRSADDSTALNAVPTGDTPILLKNDEAYDGATLTGIPFIGRYAGQLGNSLKVSAANSAGFASWAYEKEFDYAPTGNDYNLVVVDEDGEITGLAGTIVERFHLVNNTVGTKRNDGTSAYIKTVLMNQSNYILSGDLVEIDFSSTSSLGIYETSLTGGVDGSAIANVDFSTSIALFLSDIVSVRRLFGASVDATATGLLIDVADTRRSLVVFNSPALSDVYGSADPVTSIQTHYNTTLNKSSTYAFAVDNWKLVYDKYNDNNIWIPCDSDSAGLHARLFITSEPWFAPSGIRNGQLKNVIKLAWTSNVAQRNTLYRDAINSIVAFPNEGVVVWGDKTLTTSLSSFSRINVRTLFIVIRETITVAARAQIFEINDTISRAIFKSGVDRYLSTVQSRRGIATPANGGPGFSVVVDESNNTSDVLAANEFVGDISLVPSTTINTIRLTFSAVGSDVTFTESES